MDSGIVCAKLFQENNLMALGLATHAVVVVDLEFRRVVRSFDNAHTNQIEDLTFDINGRRLLSTSLDGCIKVKLKF